MAIVDDFKTIRAGLERLEAEKAPKPQLTSKHPLLLEAVIAHQRTSLAERLPPEPVTSWINMSDYIEVDRRIYTKEELVAAWGKQLDNGMFANMPGFIFSKK